MKLHEMYWKIAERCLDIAIGISLAALVTGSESTALKVLLVLFLMPSTLFPLWVTVGVTFGCYCWIVEEPGQRDLTRGQKRFVRWTRLETVRRLFFEPTSAKVLEFKN